ncbi:unnamed protein product, partial [Rhizoctonia solani]
EFRVGRSPIGTREAKARKIGRIRCESKLVSLYYRSNSGTLHVKLAMNLLKKSSSEAGLTDLPGATKQVEPSGTPKPNPERKRSEGDIVAPGASANTDQTPEELSELGCLYIKHFINSGKVGDLKQAIEHLSQAVALTSDDHPEMPFYLGDLGAFGRVG